MKVVILVGLPGCHAKGTEILLHDGSTKNVEDVIVGDLLMGPDSESREVLQLCRGKEEMVKISPTKGEPFIINKGHILHLQQSGKLQLYSGQSLNIKVGDLISNWGKGLQNRFKLTRIGVNFKTKEQPIPAYILGLWLGDGHSDIPALTTMDIELRTAWINYGKDLGLSFIEYFKKDNKATTISLTNKLGSGSTIKNPLQEKLKGLKVRNNKHIPTIYLTGDQKQRLDLLAGILDTDGSLSRGGYDYISVSKTLANDVLYLARSLGFAAYLTECKKGCWSNEEYVEGDYFRISISGNTENIPCKLTRKQAKVRKQIKDVLRTGFTYEVLPEDDYYGFTLSGDHLYLTSDFTIHHNSGKSTWAKKFQEMYPLDNYQVINQDKLGSRQKCIDKMHELLENSENVIIDRCNVNVEQRSHWIQAAMYHEVKTLTCVVLEVDTEEALARIHFRPNHETIAQDMDLDKKRGIVTKFAGMYSAPTLSEGFSSIIITRN